MNNTFALNKVERKLILLIGDLLFIYVSLQLFFNDAIKENQLIFDFKLYLYIIGFLVFGITAYVLDLYNLERASKTRSILPLSVVVGVVFSQVVFLASILFINSNFHRGILVLFLFGSPIILSLWRLISCRFFVSLPFQKNTIYIYDIANEKEKAERIAVIEGVEGANGYKVKLTIKADDQNINFNRRIIREALDKVDALILDIKDYNSISVKIGNFTTNSIVRRKELQTFSSFYENEYEALHFDSDNDSFYKIIQMKNSKMRYLYRLFSFFVDLIVGMVVGTFFFITIPIVFLLNLFFNRGPLFYIQKRVGLNGEEFKIYKFRSMVVNAEKDGAKMATKNDARITPFGKILRMFRIDELPQVISLIKGDMSFIGPRPERKVFVDKLDKITPFYNVRHLIKPGITGWAQVKYKYGENLEDSMKKLEYDLYYVKNRSITLDIRILFKTITTVLFSKGI